MNLFDLTDVAFKLHCRFDKITVVRIAHILDRYLRRENMRGSPLSPRNQVAVALLQLSGGSFQRITGLAAGGLSQNAAQVAAIRVVDALCHP